MDWHQLFGSVDLVPSEDALAQRENFPGDTRCPVCRFGIPFEAFAKLDVGEIGMKDFGRPLEQALKPRIANVARLTFDPDLDFYRLEPEEIDDPPVLAVRVALEVVEHRDHAALPPDGGEQPLDIGPEPPRFVISQPPRVDAAPRDLSTLGAFGHRRPGVLELLQILIADE